MTSLKPCPCGKGIPQYSSEPDDNCITYYQIRCPACGVETGYLLSHRDAELAWNELVAHNSPPIVVRPPTKEQRLVRLFGHLLDLAATDANISDGEMCEDLKALGLDPDKAVTELQANLDQHRKSLK